MEHSCCNSYLTKEGLELRRITSDTIRFNSDFKFKDFFVL